MQVFLKLKYHPRYSESFLLDVKEKQPSDIAPVAVKWWALSKLHSPNVNQTFDNWYFCTGNNFFVRMIPSVIIHSLFISIFYFCQACMKSCLSTLQIRKCGCADAHSAYDETIGPICDILKNRKIGNQF